MQFGAGVSEARAFELQSNYAPAGDQPAAMAALIDGIQSGLAHQTLLGVTGSGKTFSIANVIQAIQRPTLVLAHNKTLAAQLYGEFKEYFPRNSVEYFVSYYDYYQPEAYVPSSDTYIEKDASINEHIEQMRLSATKALLERPDSIIVATVSAIYGLGDPESYLKMVLHLVRGDRMDQRQLLRRLADMQYTRNELDLRQGTFRVRGDVLDIFPAESERDAVRVQFFDEEIESLAFFDPLTGEVLRKVPRLTVFPSTHYVTPRERLLKAVDEIKVELRSRLADLRAANKLLEAQRLEQRTLFDLEMIAELGYCAGHRELFPLPVGPRARRAAAVPVRLPAAEFLAGDRREPRHHAAAAGDVPGRPLAQGDAGRVRLPTAVGARQPAAPVRRVRARAAADHLRFGDTRGARTRQVRPGGRAGGAPDRAAGPGGRDPSGHHAGGRPAVGDPAPRRSATSACWSRR